MTLRIVEDGGVIKKARDTVVRAFHWYGSEKVRTVVGYPGGHETVTAHWAEDLGVWFAGDVIANSRYWNAFGTWSPKQDKMVPICCEINFPLSGINRRISGAVAEDERGRLFLVHRGQIGGGRRGIGAELFWKHFDGSPATVVDGDRDTEVVVVGSIDSPRFLRQIQFFVHEVDRIKLLAHPRETSGSNEEQAEDGIEIKDPGEGFQGTKTYTIAQRIDAACDHGIIVRSLRRHLRKIGYSIGKDRFRDLYVHRHGRITSLFEVKPDTSTTSIYTAVGQLLLHSVGQQGHSKLVFVAPEELSAEMRRKLKTLSIEVLGYRWVDDDPEFPEIARFAF